MDEQIIEKITQLAKKLLSLMNYTVNDIEVKQENNLGWWLMLKVENPQVLIGQKGINLASFQHLLRILVHRELNQPVNFVVDINDYKKRKIFHLQSMAFQAVRRVKNSRRVEVLAPMSAFERKIIHSSLARIKGIKTQSLGEEPNRRVVIKPQEEESDLQDKFIEGQV